MYPQVPAYTKTDVQAIVEWQAANGPDNLPEEKQSKACEALLEAVHEGKLPLTDVRLILQMQKMLKETIGKDATIWERARLVTALHGAVVKVPVVFHDPCFDVDKGHWTFHVSLGHARLEVSLPGQNVPLMGVVEEERKLLVRLGLAFGRQEHVLVRGPPCFKSHALDLFGRMIATGSVVGPLVLSMHTDTAPEALFGGIEPHTESTLAEYLHRACQPLMPAQDDFQAAIKVAGGCENFLTQLAGQLPPSMLNSDAHKMWLLGMAEQLKTEGNQHYVGCERGLMRSIRFGGLVVLDHVNLAPINVLAALSGLFDANPTSRTRVFRGIPVHPKFMLTFTMTTPGRALPQDFASRVLVLDMAGDASVSALSAHQRAWKKALTAVDKSGQATWAAFLKTGAFPRASQWLQPSSLLATKAASDLDMNERSSSILAHLRLADTLLRAGHDHPTPCFVGPPGCGKTYVCERGADLLGRRFERLSCSVNTQLDDLLGSLTASGDTFRFKHGLLATAIMDGALILLDEVNLLPTDVQTALLPFLSGAREIELGDGIFDARRVLFAATMNPVTFGIILWLA